MDGAAWDAVLVRGLEASIRHVDLEVVAFWTDSLAAAV